ncbi:response regulator [candidate division KSB3 bacterium]|uniref:histidine kinase n=1 Tax=candidate division KSB3 bacterium TaxID=2044937 RepID=A0A9D5JVR7_9BACT|nr:response regulator [candidate division KSB3 bacterium]MBD3324831.1 response regulator [candidate division KSB3 bacterium]
MRHNTMKILIVEDEPLSRFFLEQQIRAQGHDVTTCPNAEAALEVYQHTFYPLLVLDLGLPGMDGLELCRRIRALPQGDQSMILVITARDTLEDLQAVLEAGANDYMLKPVNQELLTVRLLIIEQQFANLIQRQRAEEALRESQRRLAATLKSIGDAVITTDKDGKITFMNPVAETLTGWTYHEAVGKDVVFEIVNKDTPAAVENPVKKALHGDIVINIASHTHLISRDATEVPIEYSGAPIKDDKGNITGVVLVLKDITERNNAEEERRQLETQLRQSQRLEAIGILAGGIAHDFNNILGTILGYTELLLNECAENRRQKEYLDQIALAGERATDLVQQILTFSRAQEQPQLTPINIAPIIREVLKMIRATIPTNIEIRQSLNGDCPPILADATQIHQMLVNLCTNASHAMRERGGILEVKWEEVSLTLSQAQRLGLSEGNYLKLIVEDTGCGMPIDVQEHIFEPFYTTKAVGEGAGLGLSVVHGIVKGHHGVITVESEPGQGTVFQVLFPITERTIVQPPSASVEKATLGKGHILIVDDEPALVTLYELALTQLGYQVTTFTQSAEALQAFQTQPDQFDAVFTDQAMPNITGVQLSQELLRIRPDILIVLTTGHSDVVSETDALALGICRFLKKPVKIGVLAQTIGDLLDSQP